MESKKRSLAEERLHCQSWRYCEISSAGSDKQLKMKKSPFITLEGCTRGTVPLALGFCLPTEKEDFLSRETLA